MMNKLEDAYTVSNHFVGEEPVVRQIYDRLLKTLNEFGPVVEDPQKTSIHLVNTTALAGVATRKAHIVLTIKSNRPLASVFTNRSNSLLSDFITSSSLSRRQTWIRN